MRFKFREMKTSWYHALALAFTFFLLLSFLIPDCGKDIRYWLTFLSASCAVYLTYSFVLFYSLDSLLAQSFWYPRDSIARFVNKPATIACLFTMLLYASLVSILTSGYRGDQIAHRVWYGAGHWHDSTNHPMEGIIIARGTTDAKELGHPPYLIVDWKSLSNETDRVFYEMTDAEMSYPARGSRVSASYARRNCTSMCRVSASEFQVIN